MKISKNKKKVHFYTRDKSRHDKSRRSAEENVSIRSINVDICENLTNKYTINNIQYHFFNARTTL